MNKTKVYFRAEGNSNIGLGHIMRSLALLNSIRKDFECFFIIKESSSTVRARIKSVCHNIIEIPNNQSLDSEAFLIKQQYLKGSEIVVLDGYQFGTSYQTIIKSAGSQLVCIDDIYANHFVADAIINPAPGVDKEKYSKEDYTHTYLGLRYSLLAPPFLKAAQQERHIDVIENIFLCFGGADQKNITLKTLKLIDKIQQIKKVNIVLGGVNPHKQVVKKFLQNVSGFETNVYENLSAQAMVDLMQASHLAIIPSSSIVHEALAIGMPIICGYYTDNQIDTYQGLREMGIIYGAGDLNTFDDYKSLIPYVIKKGAQQAIRHQRLFQQGRSDKHLLEIFSCLNKAVCKQSNVGQLNKVI